MYLQFYSMIGHEKNIQLSPEICENKFPPNGGLLISIETLSVYILVVFYSGQEQRLVLVLMSTIVRFCYGTP